MPYKIKQSKDGKFCLVREDGSIKSCHTTKRDAEAAVRIIMSKED